jgi:hypothetical protein
MILAASLMFNNGSKEGSFARTLLGMSADSALDSGTDLAMLMLTSTTGRISLTVVELKEQIRHWFERKVSRGRRPLRSRASSFLEAMLCPTVIERL